MKFLVDECLSPELAHVARARGFHESVHVTWLGLRSRKDWTIARRAVDDGYVFVTNNVADFAAFYRREEIHAGLVCFSVAHGRMSLTLQKQLFLLALEELAESEPVNEVIEIVAGPDGDVTVARYDLPARR